MRTVSSFLMALLLCGVCHAQKLTLDSSKVSFFSEAPLENISAVNRRASSIFNAATGEIVFSIPIQDFEFDRSLMKEHFNEKFLESDKFPKATFQGKVYGFDPKVNTKQTVSAKGKLTIHGVTKEITAPGTFEQQGKTLALKSNITVKLADYNITIPTVVFRKIAEEIAVSADFTYKLL